jgi:hypothetical protein
LVSMEGTVVDSFSPLRRARVREVALPFSARPRRAEVHLQVPEAREDGRGVMLEWVAWGVPRGGRVTLTGRSRFVAPFLVALVFLLLRWAGWVPARAALLASPLALLGGFGLLRDPWLVHRLLTGVVELTAVAGGLGVGLGHGLRRRGRLAPESLRMLAALALAALVGRALALNHPDFYYPDLRTHARLVEKVAEQGLGFFLEPRNAILEHGVWRVTAYGRSHAFPYSPAFHLPFVPLGLPYDTLLTAMKLYAVALSVVPLVLVWALARRLGISALGAGLMLVIPTYTSRLSFAFMPALFGHAVDMAFLLWLVARADRLGERSVLVRGAVWVAACQLAYVSGVVNISLLVAALALTCSWERRGQAGAWRIGIGLLLMGLAGSLVSVALYYRDFLGVVFDILPRALGAGGGGGESHYPIQGFFATAWRRTLDFFGSVYPLLAAYGLVRILRAGRARAVVLAWLLSYGLLLLGRAKVPDVFLHGHETTFVTPLVCLAAGEALAVLWRSGRAGRGAAATLLGLLTLLGLHAQWQAVAAQLGNAL